MPPRSNSLIASLGSSAGSRWLTTPAWGLGRGFLYPLVTLHLPWGLAPRWCGELVPPIHCATESSNMKPAEDTSLCELGVYGSRTVPDS
jgi:hypothetical protein